MNSWMAGRSHGDPTGDTDFTTPEKDSTLTYTFFRRESQIREPAQLFTLIDEDGSTINDSMFVVDMGLANQIVDLPAVRHGGVYELAFADGHVCSVKWLAASSDWRGNEAQPDPDWQNLKAMTTTPQ